MSSPPREGAFRERSASHSTFAVVWTLTQEEWRKASNAREVNGRGSDYDVRGRALYYLLNGDLDFIASGHALYGERGVNLSLLDLGRCVARMVGAGGALERITYDQLADDGRIVFERIGELVHISSNDTPNTLAVPRNELHSGLQQFLHALADAIETNVPALFDWETLEYLLPYRRRPTGRDT